MVLRKIKYIRQTEMAQTITGSGGKPNSAAADKAKHDNFAAAALGKKFIAAYISETGAYQQRKENAARASNPDADGFDVLTNRRI